MLHVDLEHLLQVATPDDQQPIQALSSDRSNPPLGVGVRVGRLHRRQEHLDTLRAEHIVECAAELRVAVVDKEAQPSPSFSEHQQEVSGLLGDPGTVRVALTPARWIRRVCNSMKNSTYNRRSQTVSTVKKSQATMPAACWRRNARHVMAFGRGAGSSLWRRSVVPIAVAETCTPSRSSSPWMRW